MRPRHATRHARAIAHLTDVDPVLGAWIERAGPCTLTRNRQGTHFGALVRSIVFQQLSGKAAGTIHGRFLDLYGGEQPTPRQLLKTSHAVLRKVGLSERKAEYLHGFAEMVERRQLPMDTIEQMDDAEIIDALTEVRGIGEWTVQMFLMFRLGRPDVLPILDLGVQNGAQKLFKWRTRPTPKRLAKAGEKWGPHRTVAAWYLWRIVDEDDGGW